MIEKLKGKDGFLSIDKVPDKINEIIDAINKLEKHWHKISEDDEDGTWEQTSTPIVQDKPECEHKPPLKSATAIETCLMTWEKEHDKLLAVIKECYELAKQEYQIRIDHEMCGASHLYFKKIADKLRPFVGEK